MAPTIIPHLNLLETTREHPEVNQLFSTRLSNKTPLFQMPFHEGLEEKRPGNETGIIQRGCTGAIVFVTRDGTIPPLSPSLPSPPMLQSLFWLKDCGLSP
jgi:hypothetical protein